MRKARIYILAAALVIVGIVGLAGCAGSAKEPCAVKLNYISDLWQGSEVYVGEVSFTVTNPNSAPVTLSSFTYSVWVKGKEGNTKIYEKIGLPEIYVPAKGKVDLNLPFFVSWYEGLFVPQYVAPGASPMTAAASATEVYKLLGAKKPSYAALQAVIDKAWDAASGPPADYVVKVSFDMLTGKGVINVPPVELTYTK
jgi:hypothetical protein